MSWRIIKFETPGKLSFNNNRLCFHQQQTDQVFFFPLEDIAVVILESLQISLTSTLMSELAEKAVTVIFCNGKHKPVSVLSPVGKPLRQTEIAFLQTGMSKPLQKRLWQRNIQQKIVNQSLVLNSVNPDKALILQKISKNVLSGDSENAEAVAARLYWECLFGRTFIRHSEDTINAALDYGYAVFRNVLINNITAHGLIASLGIHHHSVLNNFNLADDLIEPYRAFTDRAVLKMMPLTDSVLTKDIRETLLSLLYLKCRINGQKTVLINAMEETVCSFITAMKENDAEKLILPELINDCD